MNISSYTPSQTISTIRAGQAQVSQLIEALERYRATHHSFPDSLRHLVPAYLPELPEFARQPMSYRRDDQAGYYLAVELAGTTPLRCRYMHYLASWSFAVHHAN